MTCFFFLHQKCFVGLWHDSDIGAVEKVDGWAQCCTRDENSRRVSRSHENRAVSKCLAGLVAVSTILDRLSRQRSGCYGAAAVVSGGGGTARDLKGLQGAARGWDCEGYR
jgi:hypothetical protein